MSVSSEVQRTLVKSSPELWAELSDPACLATHLGELGEIRIVRTVPETTVEWEAPEVTGSVQIKPSAWGTKVTLTVTQELSGAEPQTPSERLEARPGASPRHRSALAPPSQPTPNPGTRLAPGQPRLTAEGGSSDWSASKPSSNPGSAGPLHCYSQPSVDAGSGDPPPGHSRPGPDAGSEGSAPGDSRPGPDAGSEGSAPGDSRPGPDTGPVGQDQRASQPAPDHAAESAVQGGLNSVADAGLEPAKSEPEPQPESLTPGGDTPEPLLAGRQGRFARAWRRLRGLQRFKPPPATAAQAHSGGDVVVTAPTAAAPDHSAPELALTESGGHKSAEEQREPAPCTPPAEKPPGSAGATAAAEGRSEASDDAISDAHGVQSVGATAPGEGQSEASDDAIADAHAVQSVGATPDQSARERAASERATAVLVSVLDRLGAAHHRPFSRG